MKTKKSKEQLKTPQKSPLHGKLVLAPASGPRYGGSSVGHKGPKTAIHSDGPGRTEWAINRGHTIISEVGKKVVSPSDSKMGRPRGGGSGGIDTPNPERHGSKKVGKFRTKDEAMGSNRPAPSGGGNIPSDVKLRVSNFRKGQQA